MDYSKEFNELRGQFNNLLEENSFSIEMGDPYIKVKELFEKIYQYSIENSIFWEFCDFTTFKKTVEERKHKFFNSFPDANEHEFWLDEFRKYENSLYMERDQTPPIIHNNHYVLRTDIPKIEQVEIETLVDESTMQRIQFSQLRKLEFIESHLSSEKSIQDKPKFKSLNFNGDNVELYEVIKGMIEMDKFPNHTEEEVFEVFNQIIDMNLSVKNGRDTIRKRKGLGGITKFLDEMRDAINRWNENLDSKR